MNLTSRIIPSVVVRENEAPNDTVSTLSTLSSRPLSSTSSYMPSGGPAFYVIFLQYFWYCVFEGQPRSPPIAITTHFSILNLFCHSFITHSFDVPKPAEHNEIKLKFVNETFRHTSINKRGGILSWNPCYNSFDIRKAPLLQQLF